MRSVVFSFLLLCVGFCIADPLTTTYRLSGSAIGTNTYDTQPDGTFTSVTDITVMGKRFVSTLKGKMTEGKLVSFALTQDVPGNKISVVMEGKKITQTVGETVSVREITGDYIAVYANNHPQLALTLLKAMKQDVVDDQPLSVLALDGGRVMPLKAKFKPGQPYSRKGLLVPVKRVELDLGVAKIQFAFDPDGTVLGESVPTQKMLATLDGDEGVFEDPLSKYPELSQPSYAIKTENGIGVRMRDGVTLVHNMIRPTEAGKYPVILFRTPYGKMNAQTEGEFYARRGYIYISQDCRGREASNGQWDPFVNERKDGFDTVEWIAKQPWCNGNVGMIGGSYSGYVQWAAAVEHPNGLKCIVPQVSPPDAFTNLPYDNGIPMLWSGLWWANIISDKDAHLERATQMLPNSDALKSLPLSDLDTKVLGYKVPFYQLWLSRDTMAKWTGYDTLKDVAAVKIPSLSISGWWDGDEIGTQLMWQRRRNAGLTNQWLIYGPWTHAFNTSTKMGDVDYGPDSLVELDSLYLRWFDTWLKGKSVGLEKQPKVRAFVTGENKWHDLKDWPDMDQGPPLTMYLSARGPANGLNGEGSFSITPPLGQEPDRYTYNPANVEIPPVLKEGNPMAGESLRFQPYPRQDDMLIYRTPAMLKRTTVSGPIDLDLFFSTTAKDTDFFAVLLDEDEKGVLRFVDQPGKVRASFMDSNMKRTPLTPGKIYHVDIKLWDTAHCFLPGHKMVVAITSALFPAYARNLNTGEPIKDATRMVTASQTIYHDKEHPSALRVHVWS